MIVMTTLSIVAMALLLIATIFIILNIPRNKISIKESLDLCNLAVVTMQNNGKKFNFMLDTGAVECLISKSALKQMQWSDLGQVIESQGYSSTKTETCPGALVELSYKDKVFSADMFMSKSLDRTFSELKNNTGVQVHGIIGNEFLKKYKYIIDFNKLAAYSKGRLK